ncbi:MAG: cytochrome ubiquinol oxidase subunit I [Candidatus Dormibacteraeota bacterium]|nr:cytochrome ubiquinol oxidase subunit I [Candidatus Dormibacteraeota bacterium]MBV9525832.1 cytochrome ubiquinol oxidase subunit I [Candidatus Dormibacteraeota bacterium]
MLGLQVTPPQFPALGSSLPVAILFLLHIAIAEFSVGVITLAAAMEWRAALTGDARAARYARAAANSYYLVFSLGATFAVFAVVLLIGLWGNEFGRLINVFIPLVAFAFGLFLVLTPMLAVYRNSFGRIGPRAHASLGAAVALVQTLFVVLIVSLDAYLITPFHGGLLESALDPPYIPLLIHRLIGNVSWTALFLAGYAAIKLHRSADGEERGFQAWAAWVNLRIGLVTALLMPVEGYALMLVLNNSQQGFFNNLVSGSTAWLMVLQEAFVAVVLVGGNVALIAEQRGSANGEGRDTIGLVAVGVSLAGMVVAALPSSVLPSGAETVRFVGLGAALVVTAVHLALRWHRRPIPAGDIAASALTLGRRALVTVGAFSLLTALLMGVIKESARGSYAVYGELTQAQAQQQFTPSGSLYP